MGEYYFNVRTGQVEDGPRGPLKDRMGPYATREAAEHAFEIAAERTRLADEEDEARAEAEADDY